MTATEQIQALRKVGCEDAILEITCNDNRPLPDARLKHYLDMAVREGFVARAVDLAKMLRTRLTRAQVGAMIDECLRLEWFSDAIYAAWQGQVPKRSRRLLVDALVTHGHAKNLAEAKRLVSEKDEE